MTVERSTASVLPSGSTLSLPCTPASTTTARRWVAAQLRRQGMHTLEVCEDAELIVSELVSNAVPHGRAPVTVALTDEADGLLVSVDDGGPPSVFERRPAEPTAAHGRGLAIVAVLTTAWGIRPLHPGPGKTVWGRLRDAPPPDSVRP